MIEVREVVVDDNPETGCNNGTFDNAVVFGFDDSDGEVFNTPVQFCRCGKGCNGSSRRPEIGMQFDNRDAFYDWMFCEE